jgi:hypothetical protein
MEKQKVYEQKTYDEDDAYYLFHTTILHPCVRSHDIID